MNKVRGFTLVELVVVIIILGVLAAVAVPRFVDMSMSARIASLKALAGVLVSTSENVRVACKLEPLCDYNSTGQVISVLGKPAWLAYGWLDAGDAVNTSQIDAWVTFTGFTATVPDNSKTVFTLDGAPDPANCSVSYYDAFAFFDQTRHVVVTSSGCSFPASRDAAVNGATSRRRPACRDLAPPRRDRVLHRSRASLTWPSACSGTSSRPARIATAPRAPC